MNVCCVGMTVELIGSIVATTNISAVKLKNRVTMIPNRVSRCFGEILKIKSANKTLRTMGTISVIT